MSATEATLGYRLRQHHVGVVCWTGGAAASADNITRLERAISHIAAQTAAGADPVFLPRDESSAWAWLPLGIRDRFDAAAASAADLDGDLHVAFGDVMQGVAGFRLTHRQALAAQAVALAGGSPPRVVTYAEVAPVAMMLGSEELLRAWVLTTLGQLATDDEQHARLRETLLVFLDTGGSYKATAERLTLHKNSVQYRIRRAEESLGHPVGDNRHDVELALQAGRWLGSSVLSVTGRRRGVVIPGGQRRLHPGADVGRRPEPAQRAAERGQPDHRAHRVRGRPHVPDLQHSPLQRRPVPRPASPPTRPAPPPGPRPRRRRRQLDRGDGVGPDRVLGRPQAQAERLRAGPHGVGRPAVAVDDVGRAFGQVLLAGPSAARRSRTPAACTGTPGPAGARPASPRSTAPIPAARSGWPRCAARRRR